jgi:hypothetical protein
MKIDYITQPDIQLGKFLSNMLDSDPPPAQVIFVSAFVSLQTIIRVKHQVLMLKEGGVDVRFVLGIDLKGTSQEVLKELLGWRIEVVIVKNRIPGHTFHAKLYLFHFNDHASIIIGSNNITEGGFYRNYEGAACITYELPEDEEEYVTAFASLRRFLEPTGSITYQLTPQFLEKLIASGDIPTEAEARINRNIQLKEKSRSKKISDGIYGSENIEPPPPLPANLLEGLIKNVRLRRRKYRQSKKAIKKQPKPIDDRTMDPIVPASFYMTLPTLQGSIPGEGRIPLEAIELAKEFWGWPDEYSRTVSPRRGRNRVYWNWRPIWKIWSVEAPPKATIQEVRMYMYENSSDFRFYVRPLVKAQGDIGDVVRIRRVSDPAFEYECVLARKGTAEYDKWIAYCTQPVRGSTRYFGYA